MYIVSGRVPFSTIHEMGNALSHKLEVGERRPLASYYTLTTDCRVGYNTMVDQEADNQCYQYSICCAVMSVNMDLTDLRTQLWLHMRSAVARVTEFCYARLLF